MRLILISILAQAAPAPPPTPPPVHAERLLVAMGTVLRVDCAAADRERALAATEAAVQAVAAAETRLSTWTDASELARLNAAPADRPVPISPALRADLLAARRWAEATAGAFQPAIAPLVAVWDLRGGGRLPTAAEIERARRLCRNAAWSLTPEGVVRRPGVSFEEGAFGKGRALDAARAAAVAAGAVEVLLDLGGQLAWTGGGREAAVADPRRRDQPAVVLDLPPAGSLATSGNSERGIVVAGRRLGHLLDPRGGLPAPDFGSLTVLAAEATAADCLATGLAVLGPDAALAWAEAHPGVEVLILSPTPDGGLERRASSGLRHRLRNPD
ncbi:MAG: hypothetical protein D6702_07025 [Planctomycetota bacterium]|nr:MAG: hypothetical protein D6702_07025 [Planctomycetota bacterium]